MTSDKHAHTDGGDAVVDHAESDPSGPAPDPDIDESQDTHAETVPENPAGVQPDPMEADPESLLPAAPARGEHEPDSALVDWAEYWEAITNSPHIATGLRRLDESFQPVGIKPGSIVTVTGAGDSLSNFITGRLAGRRRTIYVSFAHTGAVIAERLDSMDALGENPLQPVEGHSIEDPSTIQTTLDDLLEDQIDPVTIIIDPVNRMENSDLESYRSLLRSIKDHATATGGVVVLHAIATPQEPQARWVTEMMSDIILTVTQHRDRGITDLLELTRIDPRLTPENVARIFQIDNAGITLRRPRNIDS